MATLKLTTAELLDLVSIINKYNEIHPVTREMRELRDKISGYIGRGEVK